MKNKNKSTGGTWTNTKTGGTWNTIGMDDSGVPKFLMEDDE